MWANILNCTKSWLPVFFISAMVLFSCQQAEKPANNSADSIPPPDPLHAIPATRKEVRKKPVAEYAEKTENPLNNWYFRVQLYETERTFYYLLKLEYEEIRGQDTLKIPNFGIHPEPVIQKGPDEFSCIIGFLDKEKKFREYKKVYVKNNALKVTTLKGYAVREVTR